MVDVVAIEATTRGCKYLGYFSSKRRLLTCPVEGVVIFECERLLILTPLPGESLGAPEHHSSCQLSAAENIENKLRKIQISKVCSFTDRWDRAGFLAGACHRLCMYVYLERF